MRFFLSLKIGICFKTLLKKWKSFAKHAIWARTDCILRGWKKVKRFEKFYERYMKSYWNSTNLCQKWKVSWQKWKVFWKLCSRFRFEGIADVEKNWKVFSFCDFFDSYWTQRENEKVKSCWPPAKTNRQFWKSFKFLHFKFWEKSIK